MRVFGGNRVFNTRAPTNQGTVGCVLRSRDKPAQRYLLTCAHVAAPRDAEVGDVIACQGTDNREYRVGTLVAWTTRGKNPGADLPVDAAIVELNDDTVGSAILSLGMPTGATGMISPGDTVRMFGAQSGRMLTFRVEDTDFRIPDKLPDLKPDPPFRYIDVVSCVPVGDAPVRGDSGAAVLDRQNRFLGLHFFGATTEIRDAHDRVIRMDQRAVFCRVATIIKYFESLASPLNLEVDTSGSVPASEESAALAPESLPATPPPVALPVKARHTGINILAKTIWGEARGEAARGRIAVGKVVANRVLSGRWGKTVEDVCLQQKQFSCWNPGDPNRKKIEQLTSADPDFSQCEVLARGVLAGEFPDETGGATHYHVASMRPAPSWARKSKPSAEIGNHKFYKDIK